MKFGILSLILITAFASTNTAQASCVDTYKGLQKSTISHILEGAASGPIVAGGFYVFNNYIIQANGGQGKISAKDALIGGAALAAVGATITGVGSVFTMDDFEDLDKVLEFVRYPDDYQPDQNDDDFKKRQKAFNKYVKYVQKLAKKAKAEKPEATAIKSYLLIADSAEPSPLCGDQNSNKILTREQIALEIISAQNPQ